MNYCPVSFLSIFRWLMLGLMSSPIGSSAIAAPIPDAQASTQIVADASFATAPTWRSPGRLYRISLNSLYPAGSSNIRPIAQAISPDSELLAIASRQSAGGSQPERGALALWNLSRGTRRITLLKPDLTQAEARAIVFNPNSQQIVAGLNSGNVQVWDTTTGNPVRSWTAHGTEITAIAISPDRQFLITGSSDRTVKVWELSSGRLLQTLPLTAGETEATTVQALQISPDSRRLAIATERSIQLWDILAGRLVKVIVQLSPQQAQSLSAALPFSMAFVPNSANLATLDTDNSIKLWDRNNGARVITLRQHQQPIQALTVDVAGQLLISRDSSQSVLFWNLQTYRSDRSISVASGNRDIVVDGSLVSSLDSTATPSPITLSASGDTFAVPLSGLDGRGPASSLIPSGFGIDLREVTTGARLTIIPNAQQISFSPNNLFLVSTQASEVQIWQP